MSYCRDAWIDNAVIQWRKDGGEESELTITTTCNRETSLRFTFSDNNDWTATHTLLDAGKPLLRVSACVPRAAMGADCDRELRRQAAHLLATWLGARALADAEGAKLEISFNIVPKS